MVHKVYLVKSVKANLSRLAEASDKDHAKNKSLMFFPGHTVNELRAKLLYNAKQGKGRGGI